MITVKSLFDAVEATDGARIWVEPTGLTLDLCEWCSVQYLLPHLGPPVELWRWFEENPEEYDLFRDRYHEHLSGFAGLKALGELARNAKRRNYTLLHQGGNAEQNTATALAEFLGALTAHCYLE